LKCVRLKNKGGQGEVIQRLRPRASANPVLPLLHLEQLKGAKTPKLNKAERRRKKPEKEENMQSNQTYVGIDVSKSTLDVCILKDAPIFFSVPNGEDGIQTLIEKLKREDIRTIVVEPSGGYEKKVVYALLEKSMPVALVNPRKVRQFARALSIAAKTDRIDAQVLAEFGRKLNPQTFKLYGKGQEKLKELFRRREQVVRMLSNEKKRFRQTNNLLVRERIKRHIKFLEEEKGQLEREMDKVIQDESDFVRIAQVIKSVKGLGKITVFCLLSELPELGKVDSNSLSALVGVAPFNNDSGNRRGKRQIWGGRSIVREKLFIAMRCTIKHNNYFKNFFQSLIRRGKPFKVAIIACIRKLIVILNSLVRKGVMWDESVALRSAGVDV